MNDSTFSGYDIHSRIFPGNEIFLSAQQSVGLNSFHGQSSIKTWIMKIAIHTCYDMNHSGWFRRFDRRITPEMLPEAAVPFEERDEELITAVMRLPIKLREVILLFYYQGFSIQEIMDSLGVSQSAVTGRLKRGRDKLRGLLERRDSDA